MEIHYQILILLLIHWVADFLLQTPNMALNKSKSNYWLLIHVTVYSLVWFIIGIIFYKIELVVLFTTITFICHLIQDYITSRWTSKLYKEQKYYGFPAFFSVIGLDQYLHYIQLILCYEYITPM